MGQDSSTPLVVSRAVCVLSTTNNNNDNDSKHRHEPFGTVEFLATPKGTGVLLRFQHLKPLQTYAIHIHEFGDLREGCHSTGGHWNPHHTTHGSYQFPEAPRHAGDMINNITADEHGNVNMSYVDDMLPNIADILGRSVVLHTGADDLGRGNNAESLKTGNAGGRMMCGVIGRASALTATVRLSDDHSSSHRSTSSDYYAYF